MLGVGGEGGTQLRCMDDWGEGKIYPNLGIMVIYQGCGEDKHDYESDGCGGGVITPKCKGRGGGGGRSGGVGNLFNQ